MKYCNLSIAIVLQYILGTAISPIRLSVCRLSATLVHPTQAVVIFRNFSTAFGTLAIRWQPLKISWRSSQGNPSAAEVKHKRGSKI